MKIKLSILGMHCGSCASNIEKALRKVKGIMGVSVSSVMNKAFVDADDNVNVNDLKQAISKAGYKVVKVE